jgi:cellulose synthase/poly-beta-1,6-N-acetylglucosamine synthase-like glycosyltransferase
MNMCFEREHFLRTVGKVDESFIGYGAEDQDLGWRLQKAGYSIHTCRARIDHYETTGTISAYGSKIRRSSRDGMSTLLRVNPAAAYGIDALRKLDRAFPNRTLTDRMVLLVVSTLATLKIYRPLEWLLEKTDRISWLYFPSLYRFLMGLYYVEGARDRKQALTQEQAERGWEGA